MYFEQYRIKQNQKVNTSDDSETPANELEARMTIDKVHDRSENEINTEFRYSMNNILYEPGICG